MSNECRYEEEQLVSLLWEDGDPEGLVEMRAHVAACDGCRAALEEIASMKDLLSAWPNVVNVPRMVYVNEPSGLFARLRGWAMQASGASMGTMLKPVVAGTMVVLLLGLSVALLDVGTTPDGALRIGLAGSTPAAGPGVGETAPISREDLDEGLAEAVAYLEELISTRTENERRLLIAAVDERMREQGTAMSQELRGAVETALTDLERQHEGDLGLVFSAIDEMGVVTGIELQRMNTILASLVQRTPEED